MQRMPLELDRSQHIRAEGVALLADEGVTAKARLDADLIAASALEPDFD
jgi:hypothetical protein